MLRRSRSCYGRVVVFGACGAVGRVISLLLRCSPTVTDLRLVDHDVDDGAKGVAEDLSHIDYCTYHYPYVRRHTSSSEGGCAGEQVGLAGGEGGRGGASANLRNDGKVGKTCSSGTTTANNPAIATAAAAIHGANGGGWSAQKNLEYHFHQKKVTGYGLSDVEAALADADVVVCAAGQGRTKDMKSFDKIFEQNANVAINVATAVGKYAPPGVFFALTTSPLNCILPVTAEALEAMGAYSPERLFGMTAVHTARARCYYHRQTGRTPGKGLMVVGGQSGQTVVPLFSHAHDASEGCCDRDSSPCGNKERNTSGETTTAEGATGDTQADPLSPDLVELLTIRVNEGGGMITKYGQPSSFACAHSCREWVESVLPIIKGEAEETVLTAFVESTLFPSCKFFSSPVLVGRKGVEEILPLPPLSPYEEELLDRCLPDLETNIKRGFTYYRKKVKANEKGEGGRS